MTRPIQAILKLVAVATVAAFAGAACNTAAPSVPELADAKAVITATMASSQAAKSVHAQSTVDGKAAVALPIGGATGSIDLTGTTAAADLDKANSAGRVTFSVPGFLNLSGELIAVGGKAYLKTTLTGAQYRTVDLGTMLDPSNTNGMLTSLGEFLLKPGVDPVKGQDTTCGTKQCYTVTVDLDATELAALGTPPEGLPVNLAGASLNMTLRVEKDLPNRLAGLNAKITMADGNVVTADVTFSKWDEPVTVTAPPAEQIAPS
jgi:hypothetical protein